MDLEKRQIYIKERIYAGKSIDWIEGQLQKVDLQPDELEMLRSEAAQHFIDYQYVSLGKSKARNQMIWMRRNSSIEITGNAIQIIMNQRNTLWGKMKKKRTFTSILGKFQIAISG